jgi:hypothetical protein
MMKLIIGYYLLSAIIIIVCVLLGYFVYDKRFNRNHGKDVPDGFQRTEEINIDPVTGEKTRIYYNPDTGDRFHKKEK